jgi:hypothetical protein
MFDTIFRSVAPPKEVTCCYLSSAVLEVKMDCIYLCAGETKNVYRISVGNPSGKWPLGGPKVDGRITLK